MSGLQSLTTRSRSSSAKTDYLEVLARLESTNDVETLVLIVPALQLQQQTLNNAGLAATELDNYLIDVADMLLLMYLFKLHQQELRRLQQKFRRRQPQRSSADSNRSSSADATATEVPPTATATAVPPTATATEVPPTATATEVPPTATATAVPPTATATEVPPTATATEVPPTALPTEVPPTATEVPTVEPTIIPEATPTEEFP